MKPYLFSICIPTWNRKCFIGQLLENISEQISGDRDFQVVICDNHSTDETYFEVSRFFENLNVKYIRRDRNIGAMLNLVSAMEQADGQYCILTGDDDLFRGGWLPILKELAFRFCPDVIVSNRLVCDINMNVRSMEQCGPLVDSPTLFQCRIPGVLLGYLQNTLSTSGFGFASNLVIRRDAWLHSVSSEYVNRHTFAHMIKIMDILANHEGSILRVPLETSLARAGNDRLDEMVQKGNMSDFDKLMVHFDGFLTAAQFIFSSSPDLRAAMLAPINHIFTPEYRSYFPRYANEFGKKEVAERFLIEFDSALGVARRI